MNLNVVLAQARTGRHRLDAERFRHVVTWLIGFQLLFVGIPFLAIGVGVTRPVGPFVP